MTDPFLPAGDGATPLTDEERDGLRPTYLSTRGELNDAEQRNIAAALVRRRVPTAARLLDDRYLRDLHRAMFGEVWTWAGRYRTTERNIGVDPASISTRVRDLVDDAREWIEHATYDGDEIAVRFHHRLVSIHPFPNGNGRHSRAAADLLVVALDRPRFSWGARSYDDTAALRGAYLRALRTADAHDIGPLVAFARA